MYNDTAREINADIKIEKVTKFNDTDLKDICEATEAILKDKDQSFTIGFNRSEPLPRERLEQYWKGVLLVPDRVLFVGRLDGVIASSIQLLKPAPNNQTSSFAGKVEQHFVAPWARGFGLAKKLLTTLETEASLYGLSLLRLSVRENLDAAVHLYETQGYKRWGTLDKYEIVDGKMHSGYFYYKEI